MRSLVRKTKLTRGRFFRSLIIATLFVSVLMTALFLYVTAEGWEQRRLALGSTTIELDFDEDGTQTRILDYESWDPSSGQMSQGRRVSIQLPNGVLSLGYKYDPIEAIRARLPADVPSLTRLLDTRNPFQIYCVAEKLSESPSNALPALPKLIAAANRRLNVGDSIELISIAAHKDAVPSLATALSSTNLNLRAYCAYLLGEIGKDAVAAAPAILESLRASSTDSPGRSALVAAHFKITCDLASTLPIIRHDLTNSTNHNEKWSILHVLREAGSQGAPAMPEVLRVAHETNSVRLRLMALRAFARIGGDHSIVLPPILAALTNSDRAVNSSRSSAITALGDLSSIGLPHLVQLYGSTNWQDRTRSANTLAGMGPLAIAAREELETQLRSGIPHYVALACNIITNLGSNAVVMLPALTNVLHTPNLHSRLHSAATLKAIGFHSDTLVRVLTDLLSEPLLEEDAFRTLHSIVQTNIEANFIVEQRLTLNPRAAKSYEKQLRLWRATFERYGVRGPGS